jgi:hypothetical protein
MREITLKRFFLEEVNAESLAEDVSGSEIHLDAIVSTVRIEDMEEQFQLRPKHLIRLCDAALSRALPTESLSAIAFALMASDAFEWEDEVISEVVSDWSCPEINYPLTPETLTTHRSWLTGFSEPPERPFPPAGSPLGQLRSRTKKLRISGSS